MTDAKKNKKLAKPAKVAKVIKPKAKRKKNHFVNNGDLYDETLKSQLEGKMTDNLAKMLMLLCERYKANRIVRANFINYTFFEDMKSYALVNLMTAYKKFKGDQYRNAFAFYTQCVHRSYLQFLNNEKRNRNIRDALLVDHGMTPSFKFTEEYEARMKSKNNDTDGERLDSDDIIDHQEDNPDTEVTN